MRSVIFMTTLILASSASASVSVYNDLSSFQAANHVTFVRGFPDFRSTNLGQGMAVSNPYVAGPVTFASPVNDLGIFHDDYQDAHGFTPYLEAEYGTISANYAGKAVGFNIGSYDGVPSADIAVNGNYIGSFSLNEFSPSFVGFSAPEGVNSVSITTGGGAIDVINFSAAVPEPDSWTMLIAGFSLIGMMARRKRLASVRA